MVMEYKAYLYSGGYAASSVNSMLAALNSLLSLQNRNDYRVTNLRNQRQQFSAESSVLSKEEYLRLIAAAKGQVQLRLVIQTICATGIRVSELQYFTVAAVENRNVCVCCKDKLRNVLLPEKLRGYLLDYASENGIDAEPIFVTRWGKLLDRSNIWSQMKRLCQKAGVDSRKVYPHNLRKLFARTFHEKDHDICKLSDILVHESIETTRIYIKDTGAQHSRMLESLGLIP